MTSRLTLTTRTIRALALSARPGAIVMAEHAVDTYLAPSRRSRDRQHALDALSGDLSRIGRDEPDLARFLGQVELYIVLLQRPMAA